MTLTHDEHQRRQVAHAVRTARAARGWSIDEVAVGAGVGRMTWRRVEDGVAVRAATYAALDRFFGLPRGATVRAATGTAHDVAALARDLGVVVSDPAPSPAVAPPVAPAAYVVLQVPPSALLALLDTAGALGAEVTAAWGVEGVPRSTGSGSGQRYGGDGLCVPGIANRSAGLPGRCGHAV